MRNNAYFLGRDRTTVQGFGVMGAKFCDCSGPHVGHLSILGAVASDKC